MKTPDGHEVVTFVHARYLKGPAGIMVVDVGNLGDAIDPKGGMTAAIVTDRVGAAHVAVAICSRVDNYTKSIGREIAMKRADLAIKKGAAFSMPVSHRADKQDLSNLFALCSRAIVLRALNVGRWWS